MVPMDKYTRLVDGSYVTCTVVIGQASPGYSKDHEIKGVVFLGGLLHSLRITYRRW